MVLFKSRFKSLQCQTILTESLLILNFIPRFTSSHRHLRLSRQRFGAAASTSTPEKRRKVASTSSPKKTGSPKKIGSRRKFLPRFFWQRNLFRDFPAQFFFSGDPVLGLTEAFVMRPGYVVDSRSVIYRRLLTPVSLNLV